MEGGRQEQGGYLPPQAPGPEPEIAPRPAPAPQQAWQPPPQPQWQQPQWGYANQPDNGPAVAGFVLSLVSGGLLLISGGLSSIVSIVCGGLGIWYSLKGRRRVDAGETPKHRGLAQAGFIIGIVCTILAVLATVFWLIVLIAAINDEDFRRDLEREFDTDSIRATVTLTGAFVRSLAG
jgi:hypothetical protein